MTELILIFVVLSIVILPVVVIAFVLFNYSKKKSGSLRKCPFCAEPIQPEAIICRFCGRDLIK